MPTLRFTVDSALLRELGERLIGRPHVALAELVKNSYDADAAKAHISFDPDGDKIEIIDNGHGMDIEEFKNFWMRIGTSHKGDKHLSRRLKRPLTGSKGVGRLSVQFLADNLTIMTVPQNRNKQWLEASVNWKEAIDAGDLTEAKVQYSLKSANRPFQKGTTIRLTGLKHPWESKSILKLAKEVWWLRPPFRDTSSTDKSKSFEIEFSSPRTAIEEAFNLQLNAIMGLWTACIVGKCDNGKVNLALEFSGGDRQRHTYSIANLPHNKGRYRKPSKSTNDPDSTNLGQCDFEIRIYKLAYRQPQGIKVREAREYFEQFGGVHVYDAGFHLPHYGDPANDWLKIEFEHAHRRTMSNLLPESLQVSRGLNQLPSTGRIFGVVNVNTTQEPGLRIQITRDRLAETTALNDLREVLRYALHFYAMSEARRKLDETEAKRPSIPTSERIRRVGAVLRDYKKSIPDEVYTELGQDLAEASRAAETEQKTRLEQIGLLGPLATAGISAVAYQHELRKQFSQIERIIKQLRNVRSASQNLSKNLARMADDLEQWLSRARATNALFDPLMSAENVSRRERLRIRPIVESVILQTEYFSRGVQIDFECVSPSMRFPHGTLAEWSTILQNVLINAFHALADSRRRVLHLSTNAKGRKKQLLVQDTGVGVKLRTADDLFKPYVRKLKITPIHQAMGYGGTGLGLTIVKLIADNTNSDVEFVKPGKNYSTAFCVSWKESK